MSGITTAKAERLAVLLDELVRRIAYREDVTVLRIPADPNHDADFICRDAAAELRSLSAERDAVLSDWRETAAIVTTDEPEVGKLWEVVVEAVGAGNANREYFCREIEAHNAAKAERDALAEKADKFMWQVRDTCKRAEKAEAERDALRVERDENESAFKVWRRRCTEAEAQRDALAAECAQMREAVVQAAKWFEEYAAGHEAKGAIEKAARNLEPARRERAHGPRRGGAGDPRRQRLAQHRQGHAPAGTHGGRRPARGAGGSAEQLACS